MKNRAFILAMMALICCYLCLLEVCKTWLTVEMIKAGAPILKKATTK